MNPNGTDEEETLLKDTAGFVVVRELRISCEDVEDASGFPSGCETGAARSFGSGGEGECEGGGEGGINGVPSCSSAPLSMPVDGEVEERGMLSTSCASVM